MSGSHKTGHAEAVHVEFDPNKYPMRTLLMCFGQYIIILQLKIDRVGI
jgi:peptide methionine sulfoxide reductase MsrA